MFSRGLALAVSALPLLAVANPIQARDQCSTGPVQCCNTVQSSNDPATSALLGVLGVVLQGVDVPIGLSCDPITVIGGLTGSSCNAQAVCCQNNNVGGLVSVGCAPIQL